MENFDLAECVCSGNELKQTRSVRAESYLNAKATMVIVATGWCGDCKRLAAVLEEQYYGVYGPQGLQVLYVIYEDTQGNDSSSALEDYCCPYKSNYEMTFPVTIDPRHTVTSGYHSAVPLAMLLDGNMRIVYKEEEPAPTSNSLKAAIETLLSGE
jgi:hypothetical protein